MAAGRPLLLHVQGVSKSFPGVKALEDMHLDLRAGEVLALVGENGAGKSTLMKLLTDTFGFRQAAIRPRCLAHALPGTHPLTHIKPLVPRARRRDLLAC